jgi:thiamine pyrophosphokinase
MSTSLEILPQSNSFPFQTAHMESNKTDLPSVLNNAFPLEESALNQPNNEENMSQIQDNSYSLIDNRFFDKFEKDQNTIVMLIYLNRPFDFHTLHSLHNISSCTLVADGAANRFYNQSKKASFEEEFVPHILIGDFDSIKKDVMEYYRNKDVQIIHETSQDDTDLEKCLNHLQKKFLAENLYEQTKQYKIVIAGGLGGRLDHTLNNIHILHKFAKRNIKFRNVSIHLMDDNSIGTCILPGFTKYIRAQDFELKAGCGIFPMLGEEATVQTKGLKWNITKDSKMSFKDFVSSSNEMLEETIEFETDQIILWTTTNAIHDRQDLE